MKFKQLSTLVQEQLIEKVTHELNQSGQSASREEIVDFLNTKTFTSAGVLING